MLWPVCPFFGPVPVGSGRAAPAATIMPALEWLTSPAAAAEQDDVGAGFDVTVLLASRATVFLPGTEETGGRSS